MAKASKSTKTAPLTSAQKSAVKKYSAQRKKGVSYEDIRHEMSELEYEDSDIEIVIDTIKTDFMDGEEDTKPAKKQPVKVDKQKANVAIANKGQYPTTYDEWEVKAVNGTFHKTFCRRKNVKITEEEAEAWNAQFNDGSTNPTQYYPSEA